MSSLIVLMNCGHWSKMGGFYKTGDEIRCVRCPINSGHSRMAHVTLALAQTEISRIYIEEK